MAVEPSGLVWLLINSSSPVCRRAFDLEKAGIRKKDYVFVNLTLRVVSRLFPIWGCRHGALCNLKTT